MIYLFAKLHFSVNVELLHLCFPHVKYVNLLYELPVQFRALLQNFHVLQVFVLNLALLGDLPV